MRPSHWSLSAVWAVAASSMYSQPNRSAANGLIGFMARDRSSSSPVGADVSEPMPDSICGDQKGNLYSRLLESTDEPHHMPKYHVGLQPQALWAEGRPRSGCSKHPVGAALWACALVMNVLRSAEPWGSARDIGPTWLCHRSAEHVSWT